MNLNHMVEIEFGARPKFGYINDTNLDWLELG